MSNKCYYQCCYVPDCKTTSVTAPTKLFIHVPREQNIRNKWLKLAGINPRQISPKSKITFCEDHFNLSEDMENYIRYKVMGSVKKIIMKPGCLPSKFECLSNPRPNYLRKQRNELNRKLSTFPPENNTFETYMPETLSSGVFFLHKDLRTESCVPTDPIFRIEIKGEPNIEIKEEPNIEIKEEPSIIIKEESIDIKEEPVLQFENSVCRNLHPFECSIQKETIDRFVKSEPI